MDDVDRAEQREQIKRDEALAFRYPVPLPTGACHWCSEPIGHGAVFCCKECRDDYQHWQDCKRRNGQ